MPITIGMGGYINNQLFMLEKNVNIDEEYYRQLLGLLRIYPISNAFCRVGRHGDGGYLMVNCMRGGIAYSLGINDDVSWDEDMADRGYEVYMYDHTIDRLPAERKEFHFFKCGITNRLGVENACDRMNTLENFLRENRHEHQNDMILKMDIEGAEWDVLAEVEEKILSQFSQIVVEYHGLVGANGDMVERKILPSLRKINRTHKLVHLHGNNMGAYIKWGNKIFPDAVEATYVHCGLPAVLGAKKGIKLPNVLDEPNDPNRSDIVLGNWNEPFRI